MPKISDAYFEVLEKRKADQRLRSLRAFAPLDAVTALLDGQKVVNFAANDYLGLNKHALLKERAIEYTNKYGVGAGASRLLSGNIDAYDVIEKKLAAFKGTQSALLLNSGFQANATVLAALSDNRSLVLCDRFSHNSLLHGAQSAYGHWTRFRHNSTADLEAKLCSCDPHSGNTWIVTESVFSMDGDRAPLSELANVARHFSAGFFVDEAHATGVYGYRGKGLASPQEADIIMGTFGKAAGGFGAYVACSQLLRDYLINYCSGFIYSTALPPPVLGAIDAALELMPQMESERQRLRTMGDYVRDELAKMGLNTGNSSTQIVPVIVGSDTAALSLSRFLEDKGVYAPAIRPPTVPLNQARVRISLSAAHTDAHIDLLIAALKSFAGASENIIAPAMALAGNKV